MFVFLMGVATYLKLLQERLRNISNKLRSNYSTYLQFIKLELKGSKGY